MNLSQYTCFHPSVLYYKEWWLNILRASWEKLASNDYISRFIIISGCDCLSPRGTTLKRLHFPISEACQTDSVMQWRGEGNLRLKPDPWVWICVPALEECNVSCESYVHLAFTCSMAMQSQMESSSFRFKPISQYSLFIPNNNKGNWSLQQAAVCLVCAIGNLLLSVKHRQKSPKCVRKLKEEK